MKGINKDFPPYDGSKAARKVRLITHQVNSKRHWLRKPKTQQLGWGASGSKKNKNKNVNKHKPYKELATEKRAARMMMALSHIIHAHGHGNNNTGWERCCSCCCCCDGGWQEIYCL